MIFRTQLIVHQKDGRFGARNDQNQVDDERKAKDVVELVHPQTRHDEKELDVSSREGDDARQGHAQFWVEQGRGRRDGAGNRARHGREFKRFDLVSKVGAQKDQRNRDAAPHGGHNSDI